MTLPESRVNTLLDLARRAADTALTRAYTPIGMAFREADSDLAPAIRQLLAAGRTGEALELVAGLHAYWIDSGRAADGQALAEAALAKAEADDATEVDAASRARTMLTASEGAFRQGDQAAATAWATRALETAGEVDPVTAALAETNLARVAFRDGDAQRIEALSRRALDRAGDEPKVQRAAFHMLAWAAYTAGDRAGAIEWFERSLAVRRAMDDPFGIAVELANLGDMAMETGDVARAAGSIQDGLELAVRLDNRYLLSSLIGSTGALAVAAAEPQEALTLLAAADAAYATTSLIPDPSTREMMDAAAAEARAPLAPDTAASAEAAGRAMTMVDASARAIALCRRLRAPSRSASAEGG